jgi:hypothetical protein
VLISDPAAAGAGRVSWRLATSYISYRIQKNTYIKKNGYGYVLDGIVTAIGEIGISVAHGLPLAYESYRLA